MASLTQTWSKGSLCESSYFRAKIQQPIRKKLPQHNPQGWGSSWHNYITYFRGIAFKSCDILVNQMGISWYKMGKMITYKTERCLLIGWLNGGTIWKSTECINLCLRLRESWLEYENPSFYRKVQKIAEGIGQKRALIRDHASIRRGIKQS